MLTIKAAYHEVIESLIYYKTAKPRETHVIEVTEDDGKNAIVSILSSCISFYIEGDTIYCTVNRSEEDKQKDLEGYKKQIKSNLNRLRVWGEKDEAGRIQIETYLKAKGLDWVIEGIQNP